MARKRYGMAIDLRRCVGCEACTIACKQENHTPPGVAYAKVIKEEVGEYPHVRRHFLPVLCNHCENAPCVDVCPVGATWKREEDGIVVVDYDLCIGCRYCVTACPYGARYFDFGDNYHEPMSVFEQQPSPEYGEYRDRTNGGSPVGNVRKCTFCLHRLARGEQPACVQTCMPRARIFGDLNDPDSEISRLVAERRSFRLKEELGTEPNVFYLV
ncbi:MAG: 4Fe-4S dicluster domain-containing protein [Ardenticatenaceae bacterium]|nr:4Fe-4S dicluster domain-containing protein [Ardenticatenaceae bacterium]HBY92791.1 4Fe-4S ferredoxin [Chloroflexota bacterium]